MLVEWEVTLKCNYKCFYCTNLDSSLKPKRNIEYFIKMLGTKYPGIEIFVFGGEPFLHPQISTIIATFNKYKIAKDAQANISLFKLIYQKRVFM